MSRVAVFGAGYVGCVTAACMARDGHQVMAVDVNADKIRTIASGQSPIREPGLEELIAAQVSSGRLCPTTDAAQAIGSSDIAMIAVGTPSASDGSVNLFALNRVLETIAAELCQHPKPYTIVIRSTLLPGLLENSLAPQLKSQLGDAFGDSVTLANHPEFLRETTAIADYDKPPFIVVGAESQAAAQPVLDLYDAIDAPHVVTDTRTAALVKYVCNAFHALKIGFANEIGALAHRLGADGQEVMRIACMDRQLNISPAYLRPGFSFGGSCLPKDVRALTRYAQHNALAAEIMAAILPSNHSHLGRALERIADSGTKKVGLVGLSFKAGTDDLRESPQVTLAETLLGRGYDLRIYDPDVRVDSLMGSNLNYIDQHLPHLARLLVDNEQELFAHAELLVLATGVADRIAWQDSGRSVFDLRKDLVCGTPAA
ncbi:MAG: nucleotide sugar dehydrogenase [Pirellulales bacterium]|nr:nucleotide sugar dehydrogenase [Pirellulales bacterium]